MIRSPLCQATSHVGESTRNPVVGRNVFLISRCPPYGRDGRRRIRVGFSE